MRQPATEEERARLVGRRVLVRRHLRSGPHVATDILGILTGWTDGILLVSSGDQPPQAIPETDLIAVKAIPARPVTRREIRDLEAAATLGWRPLEIHHIGGWTLRAASGFTRRANSCIPLDHPGRALPDALSIVRDWYQARGLPVTFQLPGLLGRGVAAILDSPEWSRSEAVQVMTATTDHVSAATRGDLPPVHISDHPDDEWLAAYHYRGSALPDVAVDVLTNGERVAFASVDDAGQRVAIARGAISPAPSGRLWLGIAAVEVAPQARRRGLGSHVVAGLAEWALSHGAGDVYLQVEETNHPAQAAYRKLGFGDHHIYHYRQQPAQ
ncbi:GNAT family N-acetyltransferase [Phytoactinopolyspora limicola]|uniref:GNAT family N-acetyltransferase n=1 Tax=Phytoactinopolyspora limicola TaxID=2715536 RepID=UPI001408957C|nr:GNAT family N-acetyltransferase [Phytoactinopolyspora limicola]